MFTGPHYTIHFHVDVLQLYRELLLIELFVPGVTVWTHVGGSGKGALLSLRNRLPRAQSFTDELDVGTGDASRIALENVQRVWATVPANCAHLLAGMPDQLKKVSRFETGRSDHSAGFRWLSKITSEEAARADVDAGAARIEALVRAGIMTRVAADKLLKRWYQVMLASVFGGLYGATLRADGGTGKSVGVLASLLALGYKRILILCPAEVRDPFVGWPMEVATWTTLTPFVMLPAKSPLRKRARWQSSDDYVNALKNGTNAQNQSKAGGYAFGMGVGVAVCAYDNIGEYLDEINDYAPDALIIDEVDKVGKNSARFNRIVEGGKTIYERKVTKAKGRVNRAAGIHEVRTLRSVRTAITMSATAIDTGDPEHVWGILDLTVPGAFGTKHAFLSRYKAGPPVADSKYPQYAQKSPSNSAELKTRMKCCYLDIPHSVTAKFILDANVYTVRIPVEAQGSTRGLGLSAQVKSAMRAGDAKAGFELELAMAAMAKAPYAITRIVNALRKGQRVVAYANRIDVVEWLFERVLKEYGIELSDGDETGAVDPGARSVVSDGLAGSAGSADEDWPAEDTIDDEYQDRQVGESAPTDAAFNLATTLAATSDPRSAAAAAAGLWAVCLHSEMNRVVQTVDETGRAISAKLKGALVREFSQLPIYKDGDRERAYNPAGAFGAVGVDANTRLPALIVGSRDSIARGTNGLQESDLALYIQLGQSPGPLLQTIYRHQRPKPRLPLATDFEILIAEGTVDERVESETIALGVAAAAIAPTEGLVSALNAIRASSRMETDQLAARFNQADAGEDGFFKSEGSETGAHYDPLTDGGFDDDEDVPF